MEFCIDCPDHEAYAWIERLLARLDASGEALRCEPGAGPGTRACPVPAHALLLVLGVGNLKTYAWLDPRCAEHLDDEDLSGRIVAIAAELTPSGWRLTGQPDWLRPHG